MPPIAPTSASPPTKPKALPKLPKPAPTAFTSASSFTTDDYDPSISSSARLQLFSMSLPRQPSTAGLLSSSSSATDALNPGAGNRRQRRQSLAGTTPATGAAAGADGDEPYLAAARHRVTEWLGMLRRAAGVDVATAAHAGGPNAGAAATDGAVPDDGLQPFAFFPLLGSALRVSMTGIVSPLPPFVADAVSFTVVEVRERRGSGDGTNAIGAAVTAGPSAQQPHPPHSDLDGGHSPVQSAAGSMMYGGGGHRRNSHFRTDDEYAMAAPGHEPSRFSNKLDSLTRARAYAITCRYGPWSWTIVRSENEFRALRAVIPLTELWASGKRSQLPQFPDLSAVAKAAAAATHTSSPSDQQHGWAHRHGHHQQQQQSPQPQQQLRHGRSVKATARAAAVAMYLTRLLRAINLSPALQTLGEFLHVSSLSFSPHFPSKCVEMWASVDEMGPPGCFSSLDKHHRTTPATPARWMLFSPQGLVMLLTKKPTAMHPEKVVLLHGAVIDVEDHYPRLTKPYVLLSITLPSSTGTTRQRTTYRIKPDNPRDQAVLVHALKVAARHPYIGSHPHGSFAPPQPAHVEYFVDGQDYFERVAEGISNARHTIYILDWWLTPELYLKRPMNEGAEKWRLDRLLQRKAEEGVYIYIIVYKEIAAALSLNSFHTKFTLMGLHPNIRVIRDPDALDHLIPWSHHAKMVCIDEVVTFMGGLDLCMGRWDRHDHPLVDVAPLNTGEQVFPGQDYSNPRIADFVNVDTTWAIDILDRRKQPRMPWHDVACVVVGNPDSARHFVQRWNYHLTVNRPAHLQLPMLIPPCGPSRHSLHHLSAVSGMSLDAFYSGHHLVATQLCRSLSPWSGGVPIERSIHDAYVDLIRESRHNIYIEQQFFCCVVNNVGDALFDRVMRAHCEGQHDFRIVVCLPLLPAFTGEVDASGAGTLRMVMNFQYTTISRGPDSLYGRLNKAGVDATKYMIFSALRTWDKVPAVGTSADAAAATSAPVPPITPSPPVSVGTSVVASSTTTARQQAKVLTEMVYIHTKCMVVDDERAILGSANLNDRSLLGDRDSELAHVFGTSGVPSPVVRGLRMQLMREHCGLLGADHDHAPKVAALADLSSPEFLDLWTSTAATNTRAFRDVFRCIPDDSITTWDEYKAFVGSAPMAAGALSVADATRRLETDVRGHLVEFPLKFLEKENLGANTFSAENFMPADIFA